MSPHRWLWPYLPNALRNKERAGKMALGGPGEPREDGRPDLTAGAHTLCTPSF